VRFSAPVIGIPCDIVIRGKGVEPCSELSGGGGAIPVDEQMATGIPGVWAAGDVTSCLDLVSRQRTTNAIWPVAVEQGRVAGLNMTGAKERYAGSFARNSLRIGDWHFVSAGLTAREAEGWEIRTRRTKDGLRQIVVRADNLVGFVHAQKGATGPVNAGLSVNATGLGAPLGSLGFDPLDPDAHWGRSYYSDTANLR
jgi:NADPH-dependent 2,4-dienoyl-CoA reductase/sulfur reductase-like enzyme